MYRHSLISPATQYVLSGSAGKDAREELIRRASTHDCKSNGRIATLNLSSELSDIMRSFKAGYIIKTDEIQKDNDYKSYFTKKGPHFCAGFISRVKKDLANNRPFSDRITFGFSNPGLFGEMMGLSMILSPLLIVTIPLDKRYEKSMLKREGPAYAAASDVWNDYKQTSCKS